MPKVESKPYRCVNCYTVKDITTNHYGECYPFCNKCDKPTIWECMVPEGERPKNAWVPKPWRLVRLGDIAKIK